MLPQCLENLLDVVEVLFPTLAEDQDVIQVYHYKWVGEWPQDAIHQPHEGCRSIRQPKRQNQPFKKALLRFEGSLPHIRGFDWYLVIFELQVDLAKIFHPLELVQKVINPWDWIPIPDKDLIKFPIVNTEPLVYVLVLYQHDWAPIEWWTWPNVPFLQQLMNLPLDLILLQNRASVDFSIG